MSHQVWTEEQERKLKAAEARVRESAEKFGPLGRPEDSACACQKWPCPCACHKSPRKKVDLSRPVEACSKCDRLRPDFIVDPTCSMGGYCDWHTRGQP